MTEHDPGGRGSPGFLFGVIWTAGLLPGSASRSGAIYP